MPYLDAVERWIWQITGRTLDQHAADPVPAAAHLPASADQLRCARSRLLLAVDELRTQLINADDLTWSAWAVSGVLDEIISTCAADYEGARVHIDMLIGDPDRAAYAATNPGQPVQRRYINPGDTVMIVLPHTDVCRLQRLAGRSVPVRVNESDAELDPAGHPSPTRVPHAAAGIYRDPVESSLYILRAAAGERTGSGR
jgi:hypothetical protein